MNRIRPFYLPLIVLLLALFVTSAAAQSTHLLPESYVSDDESMTLRYPTGWFLENDQPGLVIVATSEALFDIGDEAIPPGQAAVAVLFSTADDEFLREFFAGDNPAAVLQNIIDTLFSEESDVNVEFTTPAEFTFADLPAARADGLFLGNRVFLIVTDRGDDVFNLVIGLTTEAEIDKFEPKLLAIAESVNFLPPTD